jgi:Proteasome subunit
VVQDERVESFYHFPHLVGHHRTELGRLPRVKTCANLMRRICYNNKDNLMAGLICGGWDPYEGGQVYEVPLGGTIMRQKFAIGGSGSTYIYGLVDATYKEGMTKAECQAFVKKCTSLRSFCLDLGRSLPSSTLSLLILVFSRAPTSFCLCSDFACHGARRVVRGCDSVGHDRSDGRGQGVRARQ